MKFGLLFTSHPDPKSEPYPHQAIHARVTREIIEAEELGFDSVWIAEHHFSNTYGVLPDTVIRRIEEFRKVGATSIMLRLFAKQVLPHVQTKPTVDSAVA